ncbi:large ribosomal subunit protein bL19m-like [Tubulanus polymorphus]|uniref:large ribosomal subunit protein bL19m-like n=1 Tax=Tubulanus polymorphus TaxID=672921 RepID=UPI003DA5039B
MAASAVLRVFGKLSQFSPNLVHVRYSRTLPHSLVEQHRKSEISSTKEQPDPNEFAKVEIPREFRNSHPEFLPNASWWMRDRITEKLERRDMMRRRAVIDIPEFYVGSILAVTVSDPYAPGKKNRFVGLCIERGGWGLRSNFLLRNIVDGLGVEILYELYNPTVQKIELLKLEKRLDDSLFYLRDCPPEYSTIPFDMEPIPHQKGAPVPVFTEKVPLNPRPWHQRWERADLQNAQLPEIKQKLIDRAEELAEPWQKYDLMKNYRADIQDEDIELVYKDVYIQHQELIKKKQHMKQEALEQAKATGRKRRKRSLPQQPGMLRPEDVE